MTNWIDYLAQIYTNFVIPFDFVALAVIGLLLIFCQKAKLDFNLSLGLAAATVWVLLSASGGGSQILQTAMQLIIIGIGIRIGQSILVYFSR